MIRSLLQTRTRIGLRSLRGFLVPATALVLWSCLPAAADSDLAAADARLRTRLDRILTGHGQAKTVFGGRVVELPGGRVLYDRDGARPLMPASAMKLVVIAAAIDSLGEDYRFRTVLAIHGTDLLVVGGADPTFGDERLARQRGQTITAVFLAWAETLREAGVRQIPGNLVIDDSILDEQFVHPNWPADQFQKWYEAPIGGLNFNANCTAVRVRPTAAGEPAGVALVPESRFLQLVNKTLTGTQNDAIVGRRPDTDTIVVSGSVSKEGVLGPVTVRDPGLYFGSVLKTALESEGVNVVGKVVRRRVRQADGSLPVDCHVVAVHGAPLSDALARAGKQSVGMMAEALIKLLGHERFGAGSWEDGCRALAEFLSKAKVPPGQVTVDDGSGLSRANRLSAAAAVQVLRHMHQSGARSFELLRDSLSCAGVDGTMEKRCRWPETAGRVFAKTGYIRGVRTLAGYVHTHTGRWLAFAFFYNNSPYPAALKKSQDQACRVLVGYPEGDPRPK